MHTKSDIELFRYLRKQLSKERNWFRLVTKLFCYILKRRYKRLMLKYGASIPLSVNISDDTTFPHQFYGIFISQGAEIGKECTIFQHVTIGSNTLSDSVGFGAPKIGDNVYIGAGAKIIGNVVIGNNVRIGANAIVTKNIPANATVVMSEPKIIVHEEERKNQYATYVSIQKNRQNNSL